MTLNWKISSRYATNVYSKNYSPTTGVDFYLKRTTVAASKNCALKLWDISGKAMQGRMLDKYIFGENLKGIVISVKLRSWSSRGQVRGKWGSGRGQVGVR